MTNGTIIEECGCVSCRAVNLANQAIILLIELDLIAEDVTEGGSDGVALMAAKDVAGVRNFIIEQLQHSDQVHHTKQATA